MLHGMSTNNFDTGMGEEDWRKLTLRYWFLDETMYGKDFTSSQSSVPDTDATAQPLFGEIEIDFPLGYRPESDKLRSPANRPSLDPSTSSKASQCAAGELLIKQADYYGRGALDIGEEYWNEMNRCADGVSNRRQAAARRALKVYGGNPDDFPKLVPT